MSDSAAQGHGPDCASLDRMHDPGPEGEGTFDERGWYHPPCDCGASSVATRYDSELGRSAGDSSSNPAGNGNSHPGRPTSSAAKLPLRVRLAKLLLPRKYGVVVEEGYEDRRV